MRRIASFPGDFEPLHSLSGSSSVAGRLRELVDLCICGSGVGGDSDLICSLANFSLVAGIGDPSREEFRGEGNSDLIQSSADSLLVADLGDPSREESASGVYVSRLLYMNSHENDVSQRRCGGVLL